MIDYLNKEIELAERQLQAARRAERHYYNECIRVQRDAAELEFRLKGLREDLARAAAAGSAEGGAVL